MCWLLFIGADWLVAIWDVLLEKRSRQGGLPHFEYFVHVVATGAHSSAEAFGIAGLLVGSRTAQWLVPPAMVSIAWTLIVGSGLVAIVHVLVLARVR